MVALAEVNAIYYISSRIHNIFIWLYPPCSFSTIFIHCFAITTVTFFFSLIVRPEETTVTI